MVRVRFPEKFLWGTATSAYQIEGGRGAGERGPSVWDHFAHTPGNIEDGSNGDIACDHYNRYREDVELLKGLGCGAYRFSIAWPRIFPEGKGQVNRKGIDFYQRLVDTLLENGIEPFVTLNHWDLPLSLQENGGWADRDTASYFADYSGYVVEQLGDRITYWATHNEPVLSIAICGHVYGVHAPGIENQAQAYRVIHGLHLAHGRAFRRIKEVKPTAQVGIVEAIFPSDPLRPEDAMLQEEVDSYFVRIMFDPIIKGELPPLHAEAYLAAVTDFRESDLAEIQTPLDFVGLNNYSRRFFTRNQDSCDSPEEQAFACCWHPPAPGVEFTDMGWEVYPEGLYRMIRIFSEMYGKFPIYIAENGAAFSDKVEKGEVKDKQRIRFMQGYLQNMARAIDEGYDVRGYFAWSLLDNFEWSYGYTKRFGLVYVDFRTLKRIPKASYHWFGKLCRENSFEPEEEAST